MSEQFVQEAYKDFMAEAIKFNSREEYDQYIQDMEQAFFKTT